MASVKELRLRITSVGNIQQITRAMEMVATTKLRRFQDRAIASRPYTEEIAGLVSHLAGVLGDDIEGNPLFKRGEGSKTAVLLVSSDRGLCGAYNSNLFASLEGWMADRDKAEVDFFVYGKKGYSYLKRRGFNIERLLVEPPLESVDFGNAARTAQTLVDAFASGVHSPEDELGIRIPLLGAGTQILQRKRNIHVRAGSTWSNLRINRDGDDC